MQHLMMKNECHKRIWNQSIKQFNEYDDFQQLQTAFYIKKASRNPYDQFPLSQKVKILRLCNLQHQNINLQTYSKNQFNLRDLMKIQVKINHQVNLVQL
eukprot:403337037